MKKILIIFLIVFLISALVSSISAFTISDEAVIEPSSEILVTGEEVNTVASILVPRGTINTGDSIQLNTDLTKPNWKIHVIRGGIEITTLSRNSPSSDLNSLVIKYDDEISLKIELNGFVSELSGGSAICVMNIEQKGVSSYSTPLQHVYNSDSIQNDITNSLNLITNIENIISSYSKYEIDFSTTRNIIIQTKSKLSDTENYQKDNNIRDAIFSLIEANALINSAEEMLVKDFQKKILSNIESIEVLISQLETKGLDSDAKLVNSALISLKNSNELVDESNIENVAKILQNSVDLKNTATERLLKESSTEPTTQTDKKDTKNPITQTDISTPNNNSGNSFPIIIPVIVIALVILGVVIIIIRNNRGND